MDFRKIALTYFDQVEARNHEGIVKLFDENCEVFFANFGVIKGRRNFEKVNKELIKYFKTLWFKKSEQIITVQDNRVVVEGTEFGELADGQLVEGNRMCNVFEINTETGLISRMFAYTDPSLGL